MKVRTARRADSNWSEIGDFLRCQLEGETADGKRFILNIEQRADGIPIIRIIKGKVAVDPMCGKVEVIGNEY